MPRVGRLIDALESSDYADNTIVVLLIEDHGYHLGEKGRTAKHSLWERATRVPLIFAGEFIEENKRCDAPVTLVDLYPTLLELCGMPTNEINDGRSMVPLLHKPTAKWRGAAVSNYGKDQTSVYYGDYHYIEYSNGESELYNRKQDPNEWTNITAEKGMQRVKSKLQKFVPRETAGYSAYTQKGINSFYRLADRADWESRGVKSKSKGK